MAHILTVPAFIFFSFPFFGIIDGIDPEEDLLYQVLAMISGIMLWVVAFRLRWPSPGVGAGHIIRGGPGQCLGVQVAVVIIMLSIQLFDLREPIIIIGLLGLIIWAIYRSWWTWFLPK